MADFSSGVNAPGGVNYAAPLMNFSNFSNWAADDPSKKIFDQQTQQLNAQRIAQGQTAIDVANVFKNGLPTDPKTGQTDYWKAISMMAKAGDPNAIFSGADAAAVQSASNLSPLLGGGGQSAPAGGAPASIPARPLSPPPAGTLEGDTGSGTITDIVTDRMPNQDTSTGQTILKLSQVLGVDPNVPLTPGQLKRAQVLLNRYAPAAGGDGSGVAPKPQTSDDGTGSSFDSRFAAAGGGNLPPSANAVSPAPPPAPPRPAAGPAPAAAAPSPAPVQGAPQGAPVPATGPQAVPPQPVPAGPQGGPGQPAPQAAPGQPALQPQSGPPQGMPQVPLPNGYTDPQQAILALRAEAARLAANPRAKGQVDQLTNWAERIEASIKPISMRPGEMMVDPRTLQPIMQVPGAGGRAGVAPNVINGIVKGIVSGNQPPVLTGLYSMSGPVRSALQEQGFDLAKASLEWSRAQKQVASLNGPQMTRFVGLATSVDKTIDEVRELSEQLQNSGVPLLNKGKLNAYLQVEGNSENGKLAARYVGAVNTLKEEFANLAQGGYAPTEAVWKLANEQINGNYGVGELGASLEEIQRLIRYRVQSIPGLSTMGPGATDRYTAPSAQSDVGSKSSPQSSKVSPAGVNWSIEK